MRIVVNDIAASAGGAMTVLRDFYNYVCEHDRENQWIFLLNDRYFPETENVKIRTLPQIKRSRWRKLWFDFVSGKYYVRKLQPDVVFSLQNIITFGLKVPQAVYIHQAIPFQTQKNFSFLKNEERKLAVIQHLIGWVIKRSARKSQCVIVQTNWMREAVCRQCGPSRNKVVACLPQVKTDYFAQSQTHYDQRAFFYPTEDVLYKNNDCIYKASRILLHNGVEHEITLTLPEENTKGRIRCVGKLAYADVIELYQKSTLIFPSYLETFGYPLAEARQVGTIVLVADTPFSREALQDYENAYYFDPFRPEELAQLMEAVATGIIVRKPVPATEKLPSKGWQEVVELILNLGGRG